jgi:hypothetical protein
MTTDNMKVRCIRSLDEAASELEREFNVRSRCFPRWIEDGRVNRIDAQDRLDRLATALRALEAILQDPVLSETVTELMALPLKSALDNGS